MSINKNGYTLIEILFSIMIIGSLILAITSLERSALMTEKEVEFTGYRQPVVRTLQILAHDIHSAQEMRVNSPSVLDLQVNGTKIRWLSNKDSIERRVGKSRQTWLLKKGIVFRAADISATVEIYLPDLSLHSFYSIRGGVR